MFSIKKWIVLFSACMVLLAQAHAGGTKKEVSEESPADVWKAWASQENWRQLGRAMDACSDQMECGDRPELEPSQVRLAYLVLDKSTRIKQKRKERGSVWYSPRKSALRFLGNVSRQRGEPNLFDAVLQVYLWNSEKVAAGDRDALAVLLIEGLDLAVHNAEISERFLVAVISHTKDPILQQCAYDKLEVLWELQLGSAQGYQREEFVANILTAYARFLKQPSVCTELKIKAMDALLQWVEFTVLSKDEYLKTDHLCCLILDLLGDLVSTKFFAHLHTGRTTFAKECYGLIRVLASSLVHKLVNSSEDSAALESCVSNALYSLYYAYLAIEDAEVRLEIFRLLNSFLGKDALGSARNKSIETVYIECLKTIGHLVFGISSEYALHSLELNASLMELFFEHLNFEGRSNRFFYDMAIFVAAMLRMSHSSSKDFAEEDQVHLYDAVFTHLADHVDDEYYVGLYIALEMLIGSSGEAVRTRARSLLQSLPVPDLAPRIQALWHVDPSNQEIIDHLADPYRSVFINLLYYRSMPPGNRAELLSSVMSRLERVENPLEIQRILVDLAYWLEGEDHLRCLPFVLHKLVLFLRKWGAKDLNAFRSSCELYINLLGRVRDQRNFYKMGLLACSHLYFSLKGDALEMLHTGFSMVAVRECHYGYQVLEGLRTIVDNIICDARFNGLPTDVRKDLWHVMRHLIEKGSGLLKPWEREQAIEAIQKLARQSSHPGHQELCKRLLAGLQEGRSSLESEGKSEGKQEEAEESPGDEDLDSVIVKLDDGVYAFDIRALHAYTQRKGAEKKAYLKDKIDAIQYAASSGKLDFKSTKESLVRLVLQCLGTNEVDAEVLIHGIATLVESMNATENPHFRAALCRGIVAVMILHSEQRQLSIHGKTLFMAGFPILIQACLDPQIPDGLRIKEIFECFRIVIRASNVRDSDQVKEVLDAFCKILKDKDLSQEAIDGIYALFWNEYLPRIVSDESQRSQVMAALYEFLGHSCLSQPEKRRLQLYIAMLKDVEDINYQIDVGGGTDDDDDDPAPDSSGMLSSGAFRLQQALSNMGVQALTAAMLPCMGSSGSSSR